MANNKQTVDDAKSKSTIEDLKRFSVESRRQVLPESVEIEESSKSSSSTSTSNDRQSDCGVDMEVVDCDSSNKCKKSTARIEFRDIKEQDKGLWNNADTN